MSVGVGVCVCGWVGVSGWFGGWVCCRHVCACVGVWVRVWMLCDVGACI